MALEQLETPANGAANWTEWITKQDKSFRGVIRASLTEWGNSTGEPAIEAGSIVEHNGAVFQASTDESISGATGITNGNQAYIWVSSTGGVSATTSTGTWDGDKQGYYSGNDRCIGGFYKTTSTGYDEKFLYQGRELIVSQDYKLPHDGALTVKSVSASSDAVITGDITGNLLQLDEGRLVSSQNSGYWYTNGANTEDDWYNKFSFLSTGERLIVNGGFYLTDGGLNDNAIISHIYRHTSSGIIVYYYETGNNANTRTCIQGATNEFSHEINIAW